MEPECSSPSLQMPAFVSNLSQINSIHSPYPTSWRSISILSSHLRLGLPSDSSPQVSQPKPCVHLSSPPIRATCLVHLILLDLITRIIFGEGYRSLSSSLFSFLHSPTTSYLLGQNILLSTLFFNTLGLHSSLSVSDQLWHPYKTTG